MRKYAQCAHTMQKSKENRFIYVFYGAHLAVSAYTHHTCTQTWYTRVYTHVCVSHLQHKQRTNERNKEWKMAMDSQPIPNLYIRCIVYYYVVVVDVEQYRVHRNLWFLRVDSTDSRSRSIHIVFRLAKSMAMSDLQPMKVEDVSLLGIFVHNNSYNGNRCWSTLLSAISIWCIFKYPTNFDLFYDRLRIQRR